MPKQLKISLTTEEREQVTQASWQDDRAEVRQRAEAIRLLDLDRTKEEVAEEMEVTIQSIYNWVHRWLEGGLEGLANEPRPGRKPKADETYRQALAKALEQDPREVGYRFAIWTRERLRDHLEQETGVHLHVEYLGEIMRQEGYVFRRPKHDLKNLQDPEAREAAKQLIEELKRGRSTGISSSSLWTKQP
jgi:transposase